MKPPLSLLLVILDPQVQRNTSSLGKKSCRQGAQQDAHGAERQQLTILKDKYPIQEARSAEHQSGGVLSNKAALPEDLQSSCHWSLLVPSHARLNALLPLQMPPDSNDRIQYPEKVKTPQSDPCNCKWSLWNSAQEKVRVVENRHLVRAELHNFQEKEHPKWKQGRKRLIGFFSKSKFLLKAKLLSKRRAVHTEASRVSERGTVLSNEPDFRVSLTRTREPHSACVKPGAGCSPGPLRGAALLVPLSCFSSQTTAVVHTPRIHSPKL
ncbi:hypothetical protein H920_08141 [Fukomys damarensis]|uniref:Uncharacterized protein n=1 Tax=Fukomys damarensis TaxID=885580 RepID=A0A091DJI1_FUKDA|nr:hypothetical protein H920_08141 [Fukomys damarensis]